MSVTRCLDISHHQSLNGDKRTALLDVAEAVRAGIAVFIVRTHYGSYLDRLAVEHIRRIDRAGAPRMSYVYPLTHVDPVHIANVSFQVGGAVRTWWDLEQNTAADGSPPRFPPYSELLFDYYNRGLRRSDELTGKLAGIYSNQTWLDKYFTCAQLARWANEGRLLWNAQWFQGIRQTWVANPSRIPCGWRDRPLKWALWQDWVAPFPGMPVRVDQNRINPALSLNDLLGVTEPPVSSKPDLNDLATEGDLRVIEALMQQVRSRL